MITCRDQLLSSINTHMKQLLNTNLVTPSIQQKEMIDQAASVIANDNTELACAIVQKTAIEKAIPEIDKHLSGEYELRRIARKESMWVPQSIMYAFLFVVFFFFVIYKFTFLWKCCLR